MARPDRRDGAAGGRTRFAGRDGTALADASAWRVATSDKALPERVRATGAEVVGARAFRDLLGT